MSQAGSLKPYYFTLHKYIYTYLFKSEHMDPHRHIKNTDKQTDRHADRKKENIHNTEKVKKQVYRAKTK